jgi:hypothetical protein
MNNSNAEYSAALCWFCGRNKANDKCALEVAMHEDVRQSWEGAMHKTTWRHLAVTVPRCNACLTEEESVSAIPFVVIIGVLAGGGLAWNLLGLPISRYAKAAGLLVGISMPVTFGLLAYRHAKKHIRPETKKRRVEDYPEVNRLLSAGSKFGAKQSILTLLDES